MWMKASSDAILYALLLAANHLSSHLFLWHSSLRQSLQQHFEPSAIVSGVAKRRLENVHGHEAKEVVKTKTVMEPLRNS